MRLHAFEQSFKRQIVTDAKLCNAYMFMYSGNKNIKNAFLIKQYFATYVAFTSSIKIEIFDMVK